MKRAVFLDRDGTLIYDKGCLTNPDDVILMPGVGEQVKGINDHDWMAILVTNQAIIGRGRATWAEVMACNDRVNQLLHDIFRAHLDGIFVCPHRPEDECFCRKPKPGLLYQAATMFELDLRYCLMIGNAESDIQAAWAVRCSAVRVFERGLAEWNARSLEVLDEGMVMTF